MEKAKKMSYLTNADLGDLQMATTVGDVVKVALVVIDRMPRPIRIVVGPITSGRRTPKENRERLHRTILRYKTSGVTTFNHLPFQRRAMQVLRQALGEGQLSEAEKILLQEQLRDQFYAPLIKSEKIGEVRIMPGSDASLNVHWIRVFAQKESISIRFIPEELVPK
jgi:hypothetical protein